MLFATQAFDEAVVRTIGNEDTPYTIADATTRTSLGVEAMERLIRAVGLRWPEPDEPAFGESDLAFFESYALACAALGDELTLHFARNMSMAMARIGHAAVALFLVTMGESLRGQPEPAQLAGTERSVAAFNALPSVVERLMRLHALRPVQRWRQYRDRPDRFFVQPLAVGFVDLVGFTEQTRDLDASDLAALVVRFETLAHDAVSSSGGEVVKLIGDEVTFVPTQQPTPAGSHAHSRPRSPVARFTRLALTSPGSAAGRPSALGEVGLGSAELGEDLVAKAGDLVSGRLGSDTRCVHANVQHVGAGVGERVP